MVAQVKMISSHHFGSRHGEVDHARLWNRLATFDFKTDRLATKPIRCFDYCILVERGGDSRASQAQLA